jgi:hypothetical protein
MALEDEEGSIGLLLAQLLYQNQNIIIVHGVGSDENSLIFLKPNTPQTLVRRYRRLHNKLTCDELC